eukprot:snap_masked-scaffold_26-processed-gene-3.48-mRNA-1 protein AED:1.00 eAED:1.00 QI:0/-1/0/0/-1/1/1/0/95
MTDAEKLGNAVYANDQRTKVESYRFSAQKVAMIKHQLPLTHYSKDNIVDMFRVFCIIIKDLQYKNSRQPMLNITKFHLIMLSPYSRSSLKMEAFA